MQDYLKIVLVLLVAGVLYYLVFSYYQKKNNVDRFSNYGPVSSTKFWIRLVYIYMHFFFHIKI